MKTILTTLNAKYIHTSLALRWLYVANKDKFDLSFKEFTVKEDVRKIADWLLASECDIIGLSVYIWNFGLLKELAYLLKKENPDLIIIIGGPEVMYEPEFFLENWSVDYVVSGEGEFVFGELLTVLEKGEEVDIAGVSHLGYVSKIVVQADLNRLAELPSPYMLEIDKEEMTHKLVYFETSRGCPYRCQYCLSSLEKGVRYFPQEYLFANLQYLIDNGVKQIKFLDRTFNLNMQHTLAIFGFLIANHRSNLSCQFEIYADLLKDETIKYLNENLQRDFFRFEIGIQSTYEPTNVVVKRKQDFPLLADNVRKIMSGGKIDLHLDLIAGLPFESYSRFVKSFNDVFEFGAKEVQLGFLKMLRGTSLRKNADKYGYRYDDNAPYEIRCNADISENELSRIKEAEHALEKYWNSGRFSLTMNELFNTIYKGRYFEFFDELGQFYKCKQYSHHGYQLEDLFRYLYEFLIGQNLDMFDLMRIDYYNNFKIRPNGFWKDTIDKSTKKRMLYMIGQDKEFLSKHNLTRKIIEKQTAIDSVSESDFLLIVFLSSADGIVERLPIKYSLN